MTCYEVTLIFDAILDDGDIAGLYEKAKGIIEGKNGKILSDIPMGRRKLAYQIDKKKFGFYHVLYVSGDGEMLRELSIQCSYDSSILKYYGIKVPDMEASKQSLQRLLNDPQVNHNLYTQAVTRDM